MEVAITGQIEDINGQWKVGDMGDWDINLRIKVQMSPGDFARIMNLRKQRVPMYMTIGSYQAAMDLTMVAYQGDGEPYEEVKPEFESEAVESLKPDISETDGNTSDERYTEPDIEEEAEPVSSGKRKK